MKIILIIILVSLVVGVWMLYGRGEQVKFESVEIYDWKSPSIECLEDDDYLFTCSSYDGISKETIIGFRADGRLESYSREVKMTEREKKEMERICESEKKHKPCDNKEHEWQYVDTESYVAYESSRGYAYCPTKKITYICPKCFSVKTVIIEGNDDNKFVTEDIQEYRDDDKLVIYKED